MVGARNELSVASTDLFIPDEVLRAGDDPGILSAFDGFGDSNASY